MCSLVMVPHLLYTGGFIACSNVNITLSYYLIIDEAYVLESFLYIIFPVKININNLIYYTLRKRMLLYFFITVTILIKMATIFITGMNTFTIK